MKRHIGNYDAPGYNPPQLDWSERFALGATVAFLAAMGACTLWIVCQAVSEAWR
jgi:hypothetical protein